MKILLLLVLLPSLSLAQVPSDAPLADVPEVSVRLEQGAPAPFPGRLLSEPEQVRRGKVAERDRAELLELKKPENITLTKGQLIGIVAGSAVVAAVVTGLIVGLAPKPQP